MTPEMTEQVLGLTVNEVAAYSAAVNAQLGEPRLIDPREFGFISHRQKVG
jgi:hypothetical protein